MWSLQRALQNVVLKRLDLLVLRLQLEPHSGLGHTVRLEPLVHYQNCALQNLIISEALGLIGFPAEVAPVVFLAHFAHVLLEKHLGFLDGGRLTVESLQDAA